MKNRFNVVDVDYNSSRELIIVLNKLSQDDQNIIYSYLDLRTRINLQRSDN